MADLDFMRQLEADWEKLYAEYEGTPRWHILRRWNQTVVLAEYARVVEIAAIAKRATR